MMKFDKYLKNLDITIDKKHKEEVRKKFLDSYIPPEDKKVFSFNFMYSFAAAASFLFIIALSAFSYFYFFSDGFEKQKKLMQHSPAPSTKEFRADEKDVAPLETDKLVSIKEDNEIINFAYTDDDDMKSAKMPKTLKGNEAERKYGAVKKKESYESRKKEYEGNKTKSLDGFSRSVKREEALGFDDSVEASDLYAEKNIAPSVVLDSLAYLKKNVMNNTPIDKSQVNKKDIIHYFCEGLYPSGYSEAFYFKGTVSNGYYYFLIFIKEELIVSGVEIVFYPAIFSYDIVGYSEGLLNDKNVSERIFLLDENNLIMVKLKIKEKNKLLGKIKISYALAGSDNMIKLEKDIEPSEFLPINNANQFVKNAVLGEMVVSRISSNSYTVLEIDDFKKKYIDKNYDLSPDLKLFLENYIKNY